MKSLQVMWNGKPLKKIYPYATRWQVFKYRVWRFFRKLFIYGVMALILVGAFKLGGILNPATVYTKAEVIKEVEVKAPILDRIAGCESDGSSKSKGRQYSKNGQVLVRGNKNGSVDIGKYQINNVAWGAKATELGYNLMIEKDNEAMGRWIYENRGTEDWYLSKSCWNN